MEESDRQNRELVAIAGRKEETMHKLQVTTQISHTFFDPRLILFFAKYDADRSVCTYLPEGFHRYCVFPVHVRTAGIWLQEYHHNYCIITYIFCFSFPFFHSPPFPLPLSLPPYISHYVIVKYSTLIPRYSHHSPKNYVIRSSPLPVKSELLNSESDNTITQKISIKCGF